MCVAGSQVNEPCVRPLELESKGCRSRERKKAKRKRATKVSSKAEIDELERLRAMFCEIDKNSLAETDVSVLRKQLASSSQEIVVQPKRVASWENGAWSDEALYARFPHLKAEYLQYREAISGVAEPMCIADYIQSTPHAIDVAFDTILGV